MNRPRPLAVVDIDGVLADVRHRLEFVRSPPKDWDSFFRAAPDDPLLPEGVAVVTRLAVDHDLLYLSGRPERCRRDTEEWLDEHRLPAAPVLLRGDRDRRPARLTKIAVLQELSGERTIGVLVDDDPAVCAAAQQAGFPVFRATWMSEQAPLFEAQERDGAT
ncbi:MAG TPA: hypothetical protein VGP51_10075 [Nocardioidaceae bacterium]|nr:hypothetical protein [Actinomycetota bacterium]HEV8056819.1 hypothetical protein [Nocardioidaceae bacterium]